MNNLPHSLWVAIIISGCCSNIDCGELRPILNFKYLSQEGHDLLSGPFMEYDFLDIRIYALGATGNKEYANIEFGSLLNGNSVGSVYLTESSNRWFLEVMGSVTDTLDVKLKTLDGRCCGTQSWVDELSLNGSKSSSTIYGLDTLNIIKRN